MILKFIALLAAALMLTNCCASGNGCAPVAGGPAAWDGLGTAPTEDAQLPEPKKPARAKREIIVGPLDPAPGRRDVQPIDQWEQQQAAAQDDEARLKRKLVICRGCAAGETAHDDAANANR